MKTNLSSCCNAEVETYYDYNDCLFNVCPTCKRCNLASPEVINATNTICANCGNIGLHYICEKKDTEVIETQNALQKNISDIQHSKTYSWNEVQQILSTQEKGLVGKIFKKMDEYEYHKDQVHCTCLGALREYLVELIIKNNK